MYLRFVQHPAIKLVMKPSAPPLSSVGIQRIHCGRSMQSFGNNSKIRHLWLIVFVVISGLGIAADWKAADFIAPADASKPIMIPPNFFTSQIGKGKYRLDGPDSQGKVNCIFLFFEPEDPQRTVPSPWAQIEDASFPHGTEIRERVIRNPFGATGSALLRIRVTAKDKNIADSLIQIADSILTK